jgi:hypothetical protein
MVDIKPRAVLTNFKRLTNLWLHTVGSLVLAIRITRPSTCTIIVFSPDSPATRVGKVLVVAGRAPACWQVWRGMQYRRSVKGRMLLTEFETSARTESKRMTNHNTPQLSRIGLPVHCATFHGLSRLNTQAVFAPPPLNMHMEGTTLHKTACHRAHSDQQEDLYVPGLRGSHIICGWESCLQMFRIKTLLNTGKTERRVFTCCDTICRT